MAHPRWQQLAEELRRDLAALPPGSAVPGDVDLAERYKVSRMTAAQAVRQLASEGLVERIKGHGTRTRDLRPIIPDSSRHAAAARKSPAGGPWSISVINAGMAPTVQLISIQHVTEAPTELTDVLGSDVVRRERLMLADEQPGALSVSWIPWSIANGTPLAEPIMIPEGTYRALANAGHQIVRAIETVNSRPATSQERKILRLPAHAPVLAAWRISYGRNDLPVEILETIADATRVSIRHSIEL